MVSSAKEVKKRKNSAGTVPPSKYLRLALDNAEAVSGYLAYPLKCIALCIYCNHTR